MPLGVKGAMKNAEMEHGGMAEEDANKWIARLEWEGRLVEEVLELGSPTYLTEKWMRWLVRGRTTITSLILQLPLYVYLIFSSAYPRLRTSSCELFKDSVLCSGRVHSNSGHNFNNCALCG